MKWSQDIYAETLDFASLAHKKQTYGGKEPGIRVPYVKHIADVAMEIIWVLQFAQNLNENLAIQCALLHDVIEDTSYTYDNILQTFGREVADGVSALTKNETLPTKKKQMLDSLTRIKKQPKEIWMVKVADRIANLSHPPHYWKKQKITYYKEESILIYEHLSECNELLAQRLKQKIENYR